MGYWLLIVIIFAFLAAMICAAWYSFAKKKDIEDFRMSIFAIILIFVFGIYFGIDIPSAIGGGQKLYVDRRPEMLPFMSLHVVYANGQRFIDFGNYNPDKYEQDGRYCISYTKFTKTILKIQKAE